MSIHFVAGFLSGTAGLVIGSPLDIVKTLSQNESTRTRKLSRTPKSWFIGLPAPIFSLGIMNAILFWSYNFVTQTMLTEHRSTAQSIGVSFLAGAFSGLCVCFISIPTEVIKVRAQSSLSPTLQVVRAVLATSGLSGFYEGAFVTILRDSIGYGFYFLAFESLVLVCPTHLKSPWGVLFSGGLAGCISWLSIFPLDTIKTRIQANGLQETDCLLTTPGNERAHMGMRVCALDIYQERGLTGFFSGLSAAMLRAFIVNAVIFWVDSYVVWLYTRP